MRVMKRIACIALVAASGTTAIAGEYCNSGAYNGKWVNPGGCSNPAIIVSGPDFFAGDTVTIASAGTNRWTVTVLYAFPDETSPRTFSIAAGIAGQSLGLVTANITPPSPAGEVEPLTLNLGDGDFIDVDGIVFSSSGAVSGLTVGGRITGDLDGAIVSQIGINASSSLIQLEVEGDVTGEIILRGEPTKAQDLPLVQLRVRGDVKKDITVENGGIDTLIVDGTIIGDNGMGGPAPIRIGTKGDINQISAGAVYGAIVAGDSMINPSFSNKNIAFITVTDANGETGSFTGDPVTGTAIQGDDMKDGFGATGKISIEGDFGGGTIQFLDTLTDVGQIRIGGSLLSSGIISLPTNGLAGTIMINAENGSDSWQSGGTITVGATTLTSSNYATTNPSAVGGGVSGVSPSGMYGQFCAPVNGTLNPYWPPNYLGDCENPPAPSSEWPGGYTDAVIQFGAGVTLSSTPFIIERVIGGSSFAYATDVTSQYDWDVLTGTGNDSESRVRIFKPSPATRSFDPGYEYRIRATTGGVKLQDVTGTPDIGYFSYQFGSYVSCDLGLLAAFDLNSDEELCAQDAACWMNDPVDFDDDEVADTADLGYLLNGITTWQNR